MNSEMLLQWVIIGLLGLAQNISFSIVSRSRNRNNIKYHIIAAIFSNGVWYLTFRSLVLSNMNLLLFIPYCAGTVTGSVIGVRISMFIEKLLHAASDDHLNKKEDLKNLKI